MLVFLFIFLIILKIIYQISYTILVILKIMSWLFQSPDFYIIELVCDGIDWRVRRECPKTGRGSSWLEK